MAETMNMSPTPYDRLKDGSIRVEFDDLSSGLNIPKDNIRNLVSELIHPMFSFDTYSKIDYFICIGDECASPVVGKVEWCTPGQGIDAIPFVVGNVTIDGVYYPSRKYGLKLFKTGSSIIARDVLKALSDNLPSEVTHAAIPVVKQSDPKKDQVIMFEAPMLQKFFQACESEIQHNEVDYLTDAALVRIYDSMQSSKDKEESKRCVDTLIRQKYFIHEGFRLNEYTLAETVNKYLKKKSVAGTQVASASTLSDTTQALVKALKTIRDLKEQNLEATARADASDAEASECKAALAAIEKKLAQQPDFDATVQKEIIRLINEV